MLCTITIAQVNSYQKHQQSCGVYQLLVSSAKRMELWVQNENSGLLVTLVTMNSVGMQEKICKPKVTIDYSNIKQY